jgi:hypothetical protein
VGACCTDLVDRERAKKRGQHSTQLSGSSGLLACARSCVVRRAPRRSSHAPVSTRSSLVTRHPHPHAARGDLSALAVLAWQPRTHGRSNSERACQSQLFPATVASAETMEDATKPY